MTATDSVNAQEYVAVNGRLSGYVTTDSVSGPFSLGAEKWLEIMALVAFPSDGGEVVVEIDEVPARGLERVARGEGGILAAAKTFEASLAGIQRVAAAVARTLERAAAARS